MNRHFYSYGIEVIGKEVIEDILERRRNGESLDEIADEYPYLTKSKIISIIASIEQE